MCINDKQISNCKSSLVLNTTDNSCHIEDSINPGCNDDIQCTRNRVIGTGCDNLKIGNLNVCGLKRRSKYPDFTRLVEQFDILCLSETKVDRYDIVDIPNYIFLSKPRTEQYKRKSGGIGFLIKFTKYCNDHDFVIGCMYVPPEQSTFYNDDELYRFENDISEKTYKL
ncbi:hypothetical protein ACF0H5_009450 [Mactra antiquata]